MDIFNLKKVEGLESDVRSLKRENEDLRSSLYYAEEQIKALVEIKDKIPKDCVPGSYCEGCTFAKEYHYHNYVRGWKSDRCYNTAISNYICGKGDICKNFVQKEITK